MLQSPLLPNRSPWLSLLLVLGLVMLGAFLGQWLGIRIASACADKPVTIDIALADLSDLFDHRIILILQAVTASSTVIAAPLFYLIFFAQQDLRSLFRWPQRYAYSILLLTLGLVLAFMVVNTWLIRWNMAIKLPPSLRALEVWAQQQEAARQHLTNLLMNLDSHAFPPYIEEFIRIFVMCIIPAVGEELLFRGLIQKLCHQITHNIHGAIAVSAFAFSAIHLQLYGFIPRFLLGALLGYIYWWTKSLVFPVAAHFFNNAFTLLLFFLHKQGVIQQDISMPVVLPTAVLLFFALLVVVLAYYLRQLSKT